MAEYPRISIVTPCYNDAAYLERTIVSIVSQGYPNLEYIIFDGGSTDGSVDIIKRFENHLTYWESRPDNGMYDAIQKGFKKSTGEIMGWINSDDKHQQGSLFTIAQVFQDFNHINWIQGTPTVIDETDRIFTDPHPFEVDKLFFYRRKHVSTHKFIQQESTFWRRGLWDKAGGYISQEYRYASDFDLWIRFFKYDKLYQMNAVLGSFRRTAGNQASRDHFDEYIKESNQILDSHPLSNKEAARMKYLSLLNRLSGLLERVYQRILNRLRSPTVVRENIHLDPIQQKLRKW